MEEDVVDKLRLFDAETCQERPVDPVANDEKEKKRLVRRQAIAERHAFDLSVALPAEAEEPVDPVGVGPQGGGEFVLPPTLHRTHRCHTRPSPRGVGFEEGVDTGMFHKK